MTDLQAAVGVAQLNQLGEFLEKRSALAAVYREHLPKDLFTLPTVPDGRTHVYYRFVVAPSEGLQSSDEFADYLSRLAHRGVHCRKPVFRPLHRYLELPDFPRATRLIPPPSPCPSIPLSTKTPCDKWRTCFKRNSAKPR